MKRFALASTILATLIVAPTAIGQDDVQPIADQDMSVEAPASEGGADEADKGVVPVVAPAKARIKLKKLKDGKVPVGKRVFGVGYVRPFVPDQEVRVWVARAQNELVEKTVTIRKVPGKDQGRFKIKSKELVNNGAYRVRARKEATATQDGFAAESKKTSIRYPDLDPGNSNGEVRLFNKLLKRQGYYTGSGSGYGSTTGRAVLAFRKVNGMARTTNATPGIFEMLANGKGAYKLKYPGAGKHVEADLSRQVMVLANNGKPQYTFHISSGTAATPTIKGHFRFYRKEPGTNSHGMVNSVYFQGGYATHGYSSVPTYPASHGCLRNPIPQSKFIYDWITIGDDIWVYN